MHDIPDELIKNYYHRFEVVMIMNRIVIMLKSFFEAE